MTGIASAESQFMKDMETQRNAQQLNSSMQQLQQDNRLAEQQLREVSEKLSSLKRQQMISQPAATEDEQRLREALMQQEILANQETLRRSQMTGRHGARGGTSSGEKNYGLDINGNPKPGPEDFQTSRIAPPQPDPNVLKAQQAQQELTDERNRLISEQKKLQKLQTQKRSEIDAASREDVKRCFPDSLDANHPLNAKASEIWKSLIAQKSPIVTNPDAPFIVYSMAAAALEISPAAER